jgi:NitT/TauT family transport system permease protein
MQTTIDRIRRLPGAPLLAVLSVLIALWYVAAVPFNAAQVLARFSPQTGGWTITEFIARTWSMSRPVLPAPHQIAIEFFKTVFLEPVVSPRSLVYHALVTSTAALTGFVLGALLGALLAVLIVHSRTLERGILPWIIASQMIPILAIAPIVVVILGNLGLEGLAPKAFVSMYLCFFPVTVAMVKGLRSPSVVERELMYGYAASVAQTFRKLQLPASLPYVFPALRVAISAGLVGAIVGELPTGAQAGLGARLLAGSYYGNTLQIWAALLMAALLGLALTGLVGLLERRVFAWKGRT